MDSYGGGGKAYAALIDGGSSGFAALLGGWRYTLGGYNYQGVYGYYWSGSQRNESDAWNYYFVGLDKWLYRGINPKGYGFSVRCLQD